MEHLVPNEYIKLTQNNINFSICTWNISFKRLEVVKKEWTDNIVNIHTHLISVTFLHWKLKSPIFPLVMIFHALQLFLTYPLGVIFFVKKMFWDGLRGQYFLV